MQPLDDVKVLDVSHFISGPTCSMHLGEMGAEVIKVEPKMGEIFRLQSQFIDPEFESLFCALNKNKKGITLELEKEEGARIFRKLSSDADIIVENKGPEVMEKLGLGYEDIRNLNSGIIYVSISGFGKTGPYKDRTAFDLIAQGAGGTIPLVDRAENVPKIPFADMFTGVYAALGAMYALHHRDRTGDGQLVDVSMQDVVFSINLNAIGATIFGEEKAKEMGVSQDVLKLPLYGIYPSIDGEVGICAMTDGQVKRLFKIMGKEKLIDDERFSNMVSRLEHIEELNEIVSSWTSNLKRDEIVEKLTGERIPCGPIYGISEVGDDKHLKARNMLHEVNYKNMKFPIPGICPKLSESPESVVPAPELGEHNEEIFSSLGYSEEDMEELREGGII